MAGSVTERRKEPYLGEKRNYLRDGFGTYVYENQFFRYEGEWVKGKKHGHGKLIMKDGTFYEGQFTDGEITGNGYKHFALSNAKYTGEFLCGEMHGNGMMAYKDGSVYKGQWYKNRRQGFGTLWTQKKSVYEGAFYEDMRDGEGKQDYDGSYQKLSNGDKYEGHWVQDKRHGQGQLWCADGSHYEGNFVNDLFHGEGKICHASGIYYRGMWVNGYPERMASKIVILCESPLVLQQGELFSIRVECRNDEDELVTEHGRELQILAGFKYTHPEESSSFFDMIEDLKEQPIHTPYGYDVVPYPITDQLPEIDAVSKIDEEAEDHPVEVESSEDVKNDSTIEPHDANSQETVEELHKEENSVAIGEMMQASDETLETVQENREVNENKIEEELQMVPQVQNKATTNGMCEWFNLQLAPPPPMYRPFVILKKIEEARKKPKQSKEKIEETLEINADAEVNILEADEPKEEVEESEDRSETTEQPENSQLSNNDSNESNNKESNESNNNDFVDSHENINDEEKAESLISASQYSDIVEEKKSSQQLVAVTKVEKEVYETIARAGEYVIIVREVTNPPFLGKTLEPAYLLLQVNKQKRTVARKPSSADIIEEEEVEAVLSASLLSGDGTLKDL